jgi:hypothetical protein
MRSSLIDLSTVFKKSQTLSLPITLAILISHRQPDPRGVRSRHDDRRRGGARHQVHGERGDQRRDRDGRRVSIFASLGALMLKELGVGLAVAVWVDARSRPSPHAPKAHLRST